MRLYKKELYKIFYRKFFVVGILAILVLMLGYFWFVEVGDERCVIDGKKYTGYEAVLMNKKITEEFAGTITDKKIDRIIEKYGLPSELSENMSGWQDGNYLNDFVTRFFTDGSWESETKPTEQYRLKDTDLWNVYKENKEKQNKSSVISKLIAALKISSTSATMPTLEYTTGWRVFAELLQFGMMLSSIAVISGISSIFAEEGQTRMLPLIFTTVEGKRKDITAKVLASFTMTILLYAGVVGLVWGLCKIVYGLYGEQNLTGVVVSGSVWSVTDKTPFLNYLMVLLLFGFLALLSLCAITLCVSAHQNTTFGSVVLTALCWASPLLIRIFFGGLVWILVDAMPMFLIMQVCLSDIYSIRYIIVMINVCISIVCLVKGMLHYRARQVI